ASATGTRPSCWRASIRRRRPRPARRWPSSCAAPDTKSARRREPPGRREHRMTDNPWTRLARRVAYENAWITVWHDDVLRPDGLPGIYGVVHYRSRATGVVALDEQDRVLLVGQYRYTLDLYSWELPEGGAAPGEEPLAAAKRELLEETGCTA